MDDPETLKEYAIDLSRRNIITPYVAEKLISKHRKECRAPRNCDIGTPEEQYERWMHRSTTCRDCKNSQRCNGNSLLCFALWQNETINNA